MPFGKITSLKAFSGLERLESDRADRALLDMSREKEGPERPLKTYVVGLMH
jgi:hypothetical protein